MKKHNFEQAIEIFGEMFKGWRVVMKSGTRYALRGVDVASKERAILTTSYWIGNDQISHLEQTQPMNGDEVWAWNDVYKENKVKATYIGVKTTGSHMIEINGSSWRYDHVELISPTRKLTISEATELLKGVVNEPFEIVK